MNCFDCNQDFESRVALTRHKVDDHILLRAFICKLCNELNTDEVAAKAHILEKHLNVTKDELHKFLPTVSLNELPGLAATSNISTKWQVKKIKIEGRRSQGQKGDQTGSSSQVSCINPPDQQGKSKKRKASFLQPQPDAKIPALQDSLNSPFKCSSCHKGFALNVQLKKHTCPSSEGKKKDKRTKSDAVPKLAIKSEPISDSQVTLYPCPQCDKQFHFEMLREQHVQVDHNGKDKLQCHAMGKLCQVICHGSPARIQRHIIQKHMRDLCEFVSGLTECSYCGLTISCSKDYDLSVHMVLKHPEVVKSHIVADPNVPFKCNKCLKTFYYEQMFKQHTAQVHDKNGDACVFCERNIGDIAKMHSHIMSSHMKEELQMLMDDDRVDRKCLSCPMEYNYNLDLAKHMIGRHKKDTYDFLQEIRRNRKSISTEAGTDVNMKEEEVNMTEDEEDLSEDLGFSETLSAEQGEYSCSLDGCSKKFHFKMAMERHQATAHKGLPVTKCHLCDAEYNKGTRASRHFLESHMGEFIKSLPKGKACQVCGKVLSCSKNKKLHLFKEHTFEAKKMLSNINISEDNNDEDDEDTDNGSHVATETNNEEELMSDNSFE